MKDEIPTTIPSIDKALSVPLGMLCLFACCLAVGSLVWAWRKWRSPAPGDFDLVADETLWIWVVVVTSGALLFACGQYAVRFVASWF